MVPYIEPAVRARLVFGDKVPATITIDTVNETGVLEFTDRLDEATSPPANIGPVVFTSDNPTVATVATDTVNPLQVDVTILSAGTTNVGCSPLVDTSGNPLMEADGVTPFPAVASQALVVNPGAAVGERLTLA